MPEVDSLSNENIRNYLNTAKLSDNTLSLRGNELVIDYDNTGKVITQLRAVTDSCFTDCINGTNEFTGFTPKQRYDTIMAYYTYTTEECGDIQEFLRDIKLDYKNFNLDFVETERRINIEVNNKSVTIKNKLNRFLNKKIIHNFESEPGSGDKIVLINSKPDFQTYLNEPDNTLTNATGTHKCIKGINLVIGLYIFQKIYMKRIEDEKNGIFLDLDDNIIVFRGSRTSALHFQTNNNRRLGPDLIQKYDFQSTTYDPEVAENFIFGTPIDQKIMFIMSINYRKVPIIFLELVSNFTREREILIPVNSTCKSHYLTMKPVEIKLINCMDSLGRAEVSLLTVPRVELISIDKNFFAGEVVGKAIKGMRGKQKKTKKKLRKNKTIKESKKLKKKKIKKKRKKREKVKSK